MIPDGLRAVQRCNEEGRHPLRGMPLRRRVSKARGSRPEPFPLSSDTQASDTTDRLLPLGACPVKYDDGIQHILMVQKRQYRLADEWA